MNDTLNLMRKLAGLETLEITEASMDPEQMRKIVAMARQIQDDAEYIAASVSAGKPINPNLVKQIEGNLMAIKQSM